MEQNKRGVYVVTDLSAPKAYVGSTEDKHLRFKKHDVDLRRDKHHNKHMQKAFNAGHVFEVTFIPVEDNISILEIEQVLIDEFIDKGVLYNIATDVNGAGGFLGKKHSPETIAQLKVIAKERGVPRATIEAGAAARRGKSLSPEHIEIVRQTSKDRMTPEAREHLRQVNLGIPHTAEDIERMKQIKRANSGRAVTIEGITYDSVSGAGEILGIDPTLVRYRINSDTEKFRHWNYLE